MVLRADRMLQLWAAAEPGKVIEGLTIKQEISAIKEALHKDDEEFLGQYGGFNQAVERCKELLMLPEAEVVKGVSIDDYSTFRATRFADPVRGAKFGVFFVLQTTAYFLLQRQKGGCNKKSAGGVPAQHSLKSFVFRGLYLLIGFQRADTEKSGETIATPPRNGGYYRPR